MSLFPKVLWLFSYLILTQNKPSEFFECYLSIVWSLLPDNNWWALPVFLCKFNPIKAHWETGLRPFSERLATFPPQADHVLVDLFSSVVAGGVLKAEPPQLFVIIKKLFLI